MTAPTKRIKMLILHILKKTVKRQVFISKKDIL